MILLTIFQDNNIMYNKPSRLLYGCYNYYFDTKKGPNMKYIISFWIVLFCWYGGVTFAKEKDCSDFVMMGVGPHTNPQQCLKGDVIRLPYKRIVELCDFNKAIACNNEETNLTCYCIYIGDEREKR